MPLDWRKIHAFDPAAPATVRNMTKWLKRADPWAEMKGMRQTLGREALNKL